MRLALLPLSMWMRQRASFKNMRFSAALPPFGVRVVIRPGISDGGKLYEHRYAPSRNRTCNLHEYVVLYR